MLNGQSEQGRRETDRGQRATGEELGSERAIFPIEKGHAALVVQGKFASADAEGRRGPWRGTSGARQKWHAAISRTLSQSPCPELTRMISEPWVDLGSLKRLQE